MRVLHSWILILLTLRLAATAWGAPPTADQRALAAAEDSFRLGFWERAEKQFATVAEKAPAKSELRAQAWLRAAQAQFKQGRFTNAVELLSKQKLTAGALADEYQFWLAEAQFQNADYAVAAETYSRLAKEFTNSEHFVEAGYDAALSRSKLGDWAAVESLLQQPDGAFQMAAAASPTNEFVVRGILLLGEAQFAQKNFAAAEASVQPLAGQKLSAELDWRRQFLQCRIQQTTDQLPVALAGTTNLLALAQATGNRELQAESALLKGGILERLKKTDEAIAAYETNLTDDFPLERRRQAVLKIVELLLARNKTALAVQRLEKFLGQYGKDKAADTALLTAGELHLREYLANPAANTNDWQQARAQFDLIVTNYPRSALLGKALLNRGWCWWVVTNFPESLAAFQQATNAALAEDQALARYKWADCQMQLNDYAGALTNYNFVLDKFSPWPVVRDELFEPALYQIVRASLAVGDVAAATNALGKILAWYPGSFLCDRGMLLTGEKLNRIGDAATARKIYTNALARFPKSPLAAELRLAVARTFEREKNWTAALAEYEHWLTDFPDHEAQPQALFSQAWDTGAAGQFTNALNLFTNFVAQFPTNELAPLAQNWVADYFMQQGDFKSAEANYQLLFQKWPPSLVTYGARLLAGRAAMARLGYAEAKDYFTKLINDKECPPDLVAQAFFEYGDATMGMESTDTNKPLANIEEAIRIYSKIPQLYPTNELVAPAWGRVGDCFLQLAVANTNLYVAATNAYQQALDAAQTSVAVRSQAEFGLGNVLEKMAAQKKGADATALLKQALDHYLNVALTANVRAAESPDAFWLKKAGLEAARLAEALGQWKQAGDLYDALAEKLPQLKELLAKRKARVLEHLAAEKN
jgi:tetratricopeptide (TPR) repeat protein